MKQLRLWLAALLVIASVPASAQLYNAGWNEFSFDLSYGQVYATKGGGNQDLGAVAFNYARGIHLTRSNGLTLRPGVGVLVGYADVWDGATFVSLTPKVDFGYHFTFPNSKVSLFPYIGLTTRINTWGEIKYDDETLDLFDKDEGGANRFQVGGRVGFDVHFNRFVLGLTYEHDFSEFADYAKVWNLNLKLGWCF